MKSIILATALMLAGAVNADSLQWCGSTGQCETIASDANATVLRDNVLFARGCEDRPAPPDRPSRPDPACKAQCYAEYQACLADGTSSRGSCSAWRGACEAGCR